MSYVSLYRKYRPRTFSDVVGQEVTVKILKNSIESNKIGHAYIFSGPRGTGKTSIAKIFARTVNCLSPVNGDICGSCTSCKNNYDDEMDIIEIDAASNNGVDEIREIRNSVKLMPSNLKYKVYIIDEVHMLSSSAFNALLKTLEEPPSHVIFILATTEFNKIPATVISRCQKFDFKKIKQKDIEQRLTYILNKEDKKLDEKIIKIIAKLSDGGLRDAINLLDQILSIEKEKIEINDVYNLIGEISDDEIYNLFNQITTGNIKNVLDIINFYYEEGKNFVNINNRLISLIKDIMIYNNTNNYFKKEYEDELCKFSKLDYDKIVELSEILFNLNIELKRGNNQKDIMDIYMLKVTILFNDRKTINFDEKMEEKIIVNNSEAPENKPKIDNLNSEDNLKEIKINNSLFNANKEYKKAFVDQYKDIKEYVSNKEYNAIANLLLKATPEVVGKNNILFTFKNSFEVVLFNKNIVDIQKLLKLVFNIKFSIVSVTAEEWNDIKKEYISKIKNGYVYEYIDEKVKTLKTKNNSELEKSIENIFGEDIVKNN